MGKAEYYKEALKMNWMSEKQNEDYVTVCMLIDEIKNARDFYRIINIINNGNYDFDVVNVARRNKNCLNTLQYNND